MGGVVEPEPVRPFLPEDPLAYDELTPEMVAVRALLAVLADTGRMVEFPLALRPNSVVMMVATGWTLLPQVDVLERDGALVMQLRAHRNPGPLAQLMDMQQAREQEEEQG